MGLAALGPRVVRLLLLPHVAPYCAALAPALAPPAGQRASPRATEAAHVFNALAAAAAAAVADLARAWCAYSLQVSVVWCGHVASQKESGRSPHPHTVAAHISSAYKFVCSFRNCMRRETKSRF